MKKISVAGAAALALIVLAGSVSAQPYGGYGYRDRGRGFNERAYMRCNPDVARAVRRGQFASARHHYETYGRREGRGRGC